MCVSHEQTNPQSRRLMFGLFPWMGWGRPDSIGHYLDLASAAGGLMLFPIGYLRVETRIALGAIRCTKQVTRQVAHRPVRSCSANVISA